MRHPTVKLTGGEEREEKKVAKKVGFNMEEDVEDVKPKRDGMVSLSTLIWFKHHTHSSAEEPLLDWEQQGERGEMSSSGKSKGS